jgi:hypothetical protein
MARSAPNALRPDASSWMAPEARTENLLYVTEPESNSVTVYGLADHKLVGSLTGINAPYGACSDTNGNVWVVAWGNNKIIEYAHAGTKPIRTLSAGPNADLYDCAVDPTSGNVAVTNWGGNNWYQGNVLVFTPGSSNPQTYAAQGVWFYYGCSYDQNGDLIVDGWDAYLNGFITLGELPKNGTHLKKIWMIPTFQPPLIGDMKWDGKYVAVVDWDAIALYSIHGSYASLKGYAPLTLHFPVGMFWIVTDARGNRHIVAPDTAGSPHAVQYWNYPSIGRPTATITDHLKNPFSVTVSLVK